MTARILVVDDVNTNLKIIESMLVKEYYDVITAKSGQEAIDIALQSQPDIILMDAVMPGMDGFEACNQIKSNQNLEHIPVVMLTALHEVEDRIKGLEAGADDFLSKPCKEVTLIARIKSLVRVKFMMDELQLRDRTSAQFGMDNAISSVNLNLSNAKILVVNDGDDSNVFSALSDNNHVVKVVPSSVNVIEECQQEIYDVIVVNSQLEKIDGLRVCSQLRNNEKTRNTPILLILKEENTELLVKGLDMGINDYIIFPIDKYELLLRFNTQIRRRRYQEALKSSYKQSFAMAITDGLTGIYNRRYFDTHLENMLIQSESSEKTLSLMIIDIDFFKKVNDNYGHTAGDEILRQVAERMLINIRATDLVARYGGEEFVVVMPDTDLSQAEKVAERIRAQIALQKFDISSEPGKLQATVSIGVACSKFEDKSIDIIKRADIALYEAKQSGRNQVVVSKE